MIAFASSVDRQLSFERTSLNYIGQQPTTQLERRAILNLCQFGWYKWCYYHEHTAPFPNNHEVLGHLLGPSQGEGSGMAQWILKANGHVFSAMMFISSTYHCQNP